MKQHEDESKRVDPEVESQRPQVHAESEPVLPGRVSRRRGRKPQQGLKANLVGRVKPRKKGQTKQQQGMEEIADLIAEGVDPATLMLPREIRNQMKDINKLKAAEYPSQIRVQGRATRSNSSMNCMLARYVLAPVPTSMAAKGKLSMMLQKAVESEGELPEELSGFFALITKREKWLEQINLMIDGSKLTWNKAKKLMPAEAQKWMEANQKEWHRQLTEKKTTKPIHVADLPAGRVPSYLVLVLEDKKGPRVRAAYDGGHQDFVGSATARVSSMPAKKLLLNHAVSLDKHIMSLDIKDFFLNEINVLDRPEFMWARMDQFAPATIKEYNLEQYENKGRVLMQVDKPIYGLKQAAKLALQALGKVLEQNGYKETEEECIFASTTPGDETVFVLHVDDFGIAYKDPKHVDKLKGVLAKAGYEYTTDESASKFCGFSIERDWKLRLISIYMPEYVPKALERFNLQDIAPADTPYFEINKTFSPRQEAMEEDQSEVLSEPLIKLLQEKIGTLRYLASALRTDIDVYTSKAASRQANPTKELMRDVDRIFAYLKKYPNLGVTYHASDMVLMAHTDASFDSERGSRSRSGAIYHCGRKNSPGFINGPIEVSSKIQKTISVSSAEAEYIALFECALRMVYLKKLCELFGHAQKSSLIACDNTCAVGLANGTVADAKTKHVRRKFHWIREAVAEDEFEVYWEAGVKNVADFFTKYHNSVDHHKFTSLLMTDMDAMMNTKLAKMERVCQRPGRLSDYDVRRHVRYPFSS